MVRSLALREKRVGLARGLFRELVVGLANGVGVGVVLAVVGYAFTGNVTLAVILLSSMAAASTIASMIGLMMPLALRFFGADPALASSIFVTMFTDALSFFFLLGTASLVIDRLT